MTDLLGIDDTLGAILGCVCATLESAGAPACVCSTTIGEPAIATCCACGSGAEGELWIAMQQIFRVDKVTLQQTTPVRPCAPGQWGMRAQITLARCFPTIDERGELPSVESQADAAARLHADAAAIQRAIACCADIEPAIVEQISVVTDPEGGCSRLIATVVARVSLAEGANPRPT